jgi:hypothetical protein
LKIIDHGNSVKIGVIAEGYIPSLSNESGLELISHKAACILNANDVEAPNQLTICNAEKRTVGPYKMSVQAKRTLHLLFNDLEKLYQFV